MGFDVFKSEKDGKYYFNLKARNGEIILVSQGYSDMSGCRKGMNAVKNNASNQENFKVKKSANGKHYFTLKAGNNEVIGHSQLYQSTDGAHKGIASVRQNAENAETNEMV